MNDVSGSLIAILGTDPGPVFLIYPSKRPPLIFNQGRSLEPIGMSRHPFPGGNCH